MKKKEALAADYWIENTDRIYNEDLHISDPVMEAYLAGFEKAREIAVELAMKWNRKDFEKLKGSTFIHDHFPSKRILFTSELKALGEEEV